MNWRRDRPVGLAPAGWHVTVASADLGEVLWHGMPSSQAEAEALAAEARRLRPDARIMIRPPAGPLYDWE